ncbi:hypothetical protein TNCV_757791 [Trichonephila clavipes]|nr:hypothetical protein TNCV_757791 [Trichonephila clavipes]
MYLLLACTYLWRKGSTQETSASRHETCLDDLNDRWPLLQIPLVLEPVPIPDVLEPVPIPPVPPSPEPVSDVLELVPIPDVPPVHIPQPPVQIPDVLEPVQIPVSHVPEPPVQIPLVQIQMFQNLCRFNVTSPTATYADSPQNL